MINLDLEQLRALSDAGGILSVTLEGKGNAFSIKVETRRGEAVLVLANNRSKHRTFADPKRALLLLREIGVRELRIDTRQWNPDLAGFNAEP